MNLVNHHESNGTPPAVVLRSSRSMKVPGDLLICKLDCIYIYIYGKVFTVVIGVIFP